MHARYAVEDGLETVPALDPSRVRAIAALRDRWPAEDLQVGRLFLAAAELGLGRVPDAGRTALRGRLLSRVGRAPDERLDQLVGSAVRSLLGAAPARTDPVGARLRVLNLAPLSTTEAVTAETDGRREYGRLGDLDAFLLLTARLRDALVLPPAARRPPQTAGGSVRTAARAPNQAFDAGT